MLPPRCFGMVHENYVHGSPFESCLYVYWLRLKRLFVCQYSINKTLYYKYGSQNSPTCLTCIYLHLDRLPIRVFEAETLNGHTRINPATAITMCKFPVFYLQVPLQYSPSVQNFNQPKQNLLADQSINFFTAVYTPFLYHLCPVESLSYTNWAANVSRHFLLVFPHGVKNNGEIATVVFHGFDIIKDTDGLECRTESVQKSER
jgi:hypothetical protein